MNSHFDLESELIAQIHATPIKACLVITGAGTSAIAALFAVAGASGTVIDAQVPYSRTALDSYVGVAAEQHVSRDEAAIMAVKAYERANQLSDSSTNDGTDLVGLSCTAAIATNRVRRGENRAHVSWYNGTKSVTYSIVMNKGTRDRDGEEALCKNIILNALAEACNVQVHLDINLIGDEFVEHTIH